MEILVNSITHLPEILSAVIMVLCGQKGYEVYKRRKFSNEGHDRRSGSNSFVQDDKNFIKDCFEGQAKEIGSALKTDRLELVQKLGDIIRREGDNVRIVIREGR